MNILNKLERKLGRFAIPNLMRFIIALYFIGILIGTFTPNLYLWMYLDFNLVMKGQVWRLITFLIPLDSIRNIFFFAISVYFYYIIGNSLENAWGAFRFNLYFFSGFIFNIIASLITYLVTGISFAPALGSAPLDLICTTMFFAFALIYPNMTFLVYFLIPIKAKYIAWIEGALYIYQVITCIINRDYFTIIVIFVALANFLIFFLATRNYHRISPGELKRKADYRRQVYNARKEGNVVQFNGHNVITRHKCAVCGRTELDNDQLEFRFCSKCDGNYEYCMDHLFTHEHVHK